MILFDSFLYKLESSKLHNLSKKKHRKGESMSELYKRGYALNETRVELTTNQYFAVISKQYSIEYSSLIRK